MLCLIRVVEKRYQALGGQAYVGITSLESAVPLALSRSHIRTLGVLYVTPTVDYYEMKTFFSMFSLLLYMI